MNLFLHISFDNPVQSFKGGFSLIRLTKLKRLIHSIFNNTPLNEVGCRASGKRAFLSPLMVPNQCLREGKRILWSKYSHRLIKVKTIY